MLYEYLIFFFETLLAVSLKSLMLRNSVLGAAVASGHGVTGLPRTCFPAAAAPRRALLAVAVWAVLLDLLTVTLTTNCFADDCS